MKLYLMNIGCKKKKEREYYSHNGGIKVESHDMAEDHNRIYYISVW